MLEASLAPALPASTDESARPAVEDWEPLITDAAAAAHGHPDAQTGTDLGEALTELAGQQDWAALVPVLRRLISGDTDTNLDHLDHLDPIANELRQRILNTSTQE